MGNFAEFTDSNIDLQISHSPRTPSQDNRNTNWHRCVAVTTLPGPRPELMDSISSPALNYNQQLDLYDEIRMNLFNVTQALDQLGVSGSLRHQVDEICRSADPRLGRSRAKLRKRPSDQSAAASSRSRGSTKPTGRPHQSSCSSDAATRSSRSPRGGPKSCKRAQSSKKRKGSLQARNH